MACKGSLKRGCVGVKFLCSGNKSEGSRGCGEAKINSGLSEDIALNRRMRFDFLSEVADLHSQSLGVISAIRPRDLREDHL